MPLPQHRHAVHVHGPEQPARRRRIHLTWTATYFYGTQKTTTQTGASNQFTITDACGGTDSTATGNHGDLNVTVTITDSVGNSQTITSGEGTQPALRIVRFTC